MPESDPGVDADGATRRQVARESGDGGERDRHAGECRGVARRDAEEHVLDEASDDTE